MSSRMLSIFRTGAQLLGGYLFTYLASHGIDVPVEQQKWFIQVGLVAAFGVAYTAAIRWLETRHGDGFWATNARRLGKLLMLGLSGRQPIYVTGDERLRVIGADGSMRPPK